MTLSAFRTALLAAALFPAICAAAPAGAPPERAIDPAKSKAQFSVSHIWVERVVGTVPIAGGSVTLPAGSAIPSAVTATLDARNIVTDEPDRNKALESSDFFDAAKFPTWTFASTKIVPTGPSGFEMDGDLTIHGVTQPERLTVTVGGDGENPTYHATGQVDRHAFGMTVTRLDPTIGGTVDVTLDITLR